MVDCKENYKFDLGVEGLKLLARKVWKPILNIFPSLVSPLSKSLNSQDLIGNSPFCLSYSSCDVSLKNLVLDQLIIS